MPSRRLLVQLLEDCEARLAAVTAMQESHAAEPAPRRDRRLMMFLDKERSVYSFAIEILRRLRDEP